MSPKLSSNVAFPNERMPSGRRVPSSKSPRTAIGIHEQRTSLTIPQDCEAGLQKRGVPCGKSKVPPGNDPISNSMGRNFWRIGYVCNEQFSGYHLLERSWLLPTCRRFTAHLRALTVVPWGGDDEGVSTVEAGGARSWKLRFQTLLMKSTSASGLRSEATETIRCVYLALVPTSTRAGFLRKNLLRAIRGWKQGLREGDAGCPRPITMPERMP